MDNKSKITNKKNLKILIAEDDKFISRAFIDHLTRLGHVAISAFDGQEAINKIKKEQPDLLLLDLVMPVKHGFEVLKEIKEDKKLKNMPIIVFSNLADQIDIERALELGAKEYLLKANFSLAEVVAKIKGYVK